MNKKRNEFETIFYDLSNPQSENYGKWLSIEDINGLLPVPREHVESVLRMLSIYGVKDVKVNAQHDIISATMKATIAEKMFETTLYHFTHVTRTTLNLIRCGSSYSLPADVARHVQYVSELIRLPRVRQLTLIKPTETSEPTSSSAWDQCGTKYTEFVNPAVLQERYGYPTLSKVASGNTMAVAEFAEQYWDTTDLEKFASECSLKTGSVTTQYGTNSESYCTDGGLERCVESLLDIEYITQVGYGIPLSVYYDATYDLATWLDTVSSNANVELVFSVSYGNDEAQQTSNDYMYSVNTQFMKLGSRGVSVMIAAGDQGVWGREGTTGDVFHPDFPASSPYVTAVGGTDFDVKSTIGTEKAWEDGGGGFSNTFPIPSYQATAVAEYLKSENLPASKYYNSSGRGYPDVSALAGTQNAYFISYKGGSFTGVGGTSAASPVFAGVVAQLNNIRLLSGKSSLGFLNTLFYQNAGAFNDVELGTNDGGNKIGFTAGAGWDAATGFGTPNFAALEKII